MTAYGGSAILFNYTTVYGAPNLGVADFVPLPAALAKNSNQTAWLNGWPNGAPTWQAATGESLAVFKARILADCAANGTHGQIVYICEGAGFFENNG